MNIVKLGSLIVGLQLLLATAHAAPVNLSLNADRHVADARFAIAAKADMKEVKKEDAGKPDLVPNEFTISKLTTANKKDQCEFALKVRVKNIGTAKAGKSKLDIKVGNKVIKSRKVESLKPGKRSSKKTVTGKVGLGTHNITVVADAKGTVDELKEGNNSSVKQIICKKKDK